MTFVHRLWLKKRKIRSSSSACVSIVAPPPTDSCPTNTRAFISVTLVNQHSSMMRFNPCAPAKCWGTCVPSLSKFVHCIDIPVVRSFQACLNPTQPFPTTVSLLSPFTHPGAGSIPQVSHHLVMECGIPANLQCCCGTAAETGFDPTLHKILQDLLLVLILCTHRYRV